MSGATFIMMINLAVAGLIAAAFLAIATYERTREAGHWLAFAYLLGMLYCGVEFGIRLIDDAPAMVALSAAVLLFGMAAFNVGLAIRYRAGSPAYLSLFIVVVGTIVAYLVNDLPRHSFTRMMAFQGPYCAMQVVAAGIVIRGAGQKVDYLLAGLLGVSALQFLSKPFIAYAAGGWGENPATYLDSNYAMISQTMGTVSAFAVALATLVVLVGDILSEATVKSETDTLSGLRNRGGFESLAERAIERARRQGLPVSLVACDLDHFKSVNDTYGHAAGDRVLVAFAKFLEKAVSHGHVAGRIGGEEFAILLPGTNLATARLFAEGARSAFSAMTIDGLPEDKHFTASFGVAQLAAGESLEDMMRRADEALYAAKREGRDRVCVSGITGPVAAVTRFSW